MTNPTKFTWTDPTINTDGTPIAVGEITGYDIGVRSTTAAGSVAGTYPIVATAAGAAAASELLSAFSTVFAPGIYAAAIRAAGPVDSAWSSEITFTIAPAQPSPPSNFGVS